jgi:hypothetical protein
MPAKAMAGTLRDVVARAVNQELARRAGPAEPPPGACCRCPPDRSCRVVAWRRAAMAGAARGPATRNTPVGRLVSLCGIVRALFNLLRLSASTTHPSGGSFMQVKFNAIVGAAVVLMAGSASAQDMVVKIGHVGPTSGRSRTWARTTRTAPAWPSTSSTPRA